MKVLRRNYLGLRITEDSLQGVALQRKKEKCLLAGVRAFSMKPGVLQISLREPNVLQPKVFVEAVTEVLAPLAGREDRVAFCLPDSCGRVVITDFESPFKTRAEGRDILRWQLKKNLPSELGDIHLDFQVLGRSESGHQQALVSLMNRSVLDQYEELILQAGFHAALIDFNSFHLYSYYRPRLEMGENFAFIGVEGRTLNIEIFQDGVLVFHRVRESAENPDRVFQELSRSLVGYQAAHPILRKSAVYLHSDWDNTDPLQQALMSIFEKAPLLLNPHLERLVPQEPGRDTINNPNLISAIGAAERMM